MKRTYNKNSKLDFGMYKGYDLGIVYVFDPPYIEWCINNIDNFHVTDLNELMDLGVINTNLDWVIKLIGDPSLIENINDFKTFRELAANIDLGERKFLFSQEAIEINEENSHSSNYKRRNDDYDDYESDYGYEDYEDGPSCEKYGGYNGYDDDTIDSAFDGDPMNTWNVD